MNYGILMLRKDSIINDFIRKKRNIVYGARAMNVQLPLGFQRPTFDFDLYSKKPKRHATLLEQMMDSLTPYDDFYVKPAKHKGTFRIMDKGLDKRKGTRDDFNLVDFTQPRRKIRTINIFKIRYAHLSERAKDARRSLRNPLFNFRHKKDRMDLWRIKQARRIKNIF